MPISATGISPNSGVSAAGRRAPGFTLLELLVVLFIIGIVLGFAVLSLDDRAGADRLQREAERLRALMDVAGEESVLFGVELGLDLTPDGYRFLRLDQDGWRPIDAGGHPLRPRKLPEGMALRLLREEAAGRRLYSGGGQDGGASQGPKSEAPKPEVLFLSSGEITPFELELVADGVAPRWLYRGQENGKLAMRMEMPAT